MDELVIILMNVNNKEHEKQEVMKANPSHGQSNLSAEVPGKSALSQEESRWEKGQVEGQKIMQKGQQRNNWTDMIQFFHLNLIL